MPPHFTAPDDAVEFDFDGGALAAKFLQIRLDRHGRFGRRLIGRQMIDAVEKSGFLLIVTVFRLRCIGSCY